MALIAVLVIAALVAWQVVQRRKSEALREKFGPEYEHAVETYGDTRHAEEALAARERRVKKLDIHPLPHDQYYRFTDEWQQVQAGFVDDPVAAVKDANRLVTVVMAARGYPMGDFEQRAADISVDHPNVVMNYRAARDIAAVSRLVGSAARARTRKGEDAMNKSKEELMERTLEEKNRA